MELVTTLPPDTALREVPATVARIEALGFDTVHVPETTHDSLSVALLALEHSRAITVRTSMTLAFPRSPMTTAYAAWDLARYAQGRFQLGLATQVRGNIVDRFSMPWDRPAAQLRDYLLSLHAIFTAFETGEPLHHQGSHYRFTRLQPYFNPGPLDGLPAPQLWTGGVNKAMCEVAGEVADGFVTHATNSHPDHLRDVVLPALRAGAQRAARPVPPVVVVTRSLTGADEAALARAVAAARPELAFLWSTPTYRPTLERLGLGEVGQRLHSMATKGQWEDLESVLDDETLARLIPHGTHDTLPAVLDVAYGGVAAGLGLSLPRDEQEDDSLGRLVERLKRLPTPCHRRRP